MDIVGKGICRLSVVPVRSEPFHKAELATQLLFGEHYAVLNKNETGEWLQIKIYHDNYEGWIPENQHSEISDEYFEQINNSDYKICTDLNTTILFKKNKLNILMGSIIPIATNEIFQMEEKLAFNGEAKSLSQKRDAEFILQKTKALLNTPYLWGGRTPYGIDCSGFTQLIFRLAGYRIPRDSRFQAGVGTEINSSDLLEPADLIFFKNKDGNTDHVGIYMGDEQIIHASGRVHTDFLVEDGIKNKISGKITHRNPYFKRIIN